MISLGVPLSFFFPLLMLKDSFFLSSFLGLDLVSFFMLCIFPLIMVLIFTPIFSFSASKEKLFYCFIFSLVFISLFFCFSSCNSFSFLIFLENCSILMVLFIVSFSKDPDKISSSVFMFLFNTIPSILFMFFCQEFFHSSELYSLISMQSFSFFLFFCFLGLLVSKLPLFFFHFWLTKAHVSASGCGSMVLASVMLKLGSMGLIKFYSYFMLVYSSISSLFLSTVVFFSSFFLIMMIRFFDLKYLVACSSIIHMSPIFCFSLLGDSASIMGSCLMQVGHGLVSCFIFFIITLYYEITFHRSMEQNKNISFSIPMIFLFSSSFFLLNLGFPPFCSFISELVFSFCFLEFSLLIFSIFCVTLIFSGIFFFIVLSKSVFGKKSNFVVNNFSSHIHSFYYFYLFFFLYLPFFFY